MEKDDWLSVGTYPDYISAQVGSGLLSAAGIANRIWPDLRRVGVTADEECYVWVSPEMADEAKRILTATPVSEDELTQLALQSPPPDDA
jgi:hypothetical protein